MRLLITGTEPDGKSCAFSGTNVEIDSLASGFATGSRTPPSRSHRRH
jgi:hypothetical protein